MFPIRNILWERDGELQPRSHVTFWHGSVRKDRRAGQGAGWRDRTLRIDSNVKRDDFFAEQHGGHGGVTPPLPHCVASRQSSSVVTPSCNKARLAGAHVVV